MLFDGLCAASAGVIMPLLREMYGLSYSYTGTLLAVYSTGNLAAGLLCACLPAKIGQRNTARILTSGFAIGYGMLLLSGITGSAKSTEAASAAAAVLPAGVLLPAAFLTAGLGKGSTINNCMVIAGSVPGRRTEGVNLVNAVFAVGSLLSPILYIVFGNSPFRLLPIAAVTCSGLMVWGLVMTLRLDSGIKKKGEKTDTGFLKDRHFLLSVGYLFMNQCAEISVTGWLVTYFKDTGILSGIYSELTVTVIWTSMLIGRLLIAFVLKPDSPLRSLRLMSAASLAAYVVMLFAPSGAAAVTALFLFGLSDSGCYPTSIAQAGKVLSNASVGIMVPIAGIGAVVMPYIVGAAAQTFGIAAGMLCPAAALAGMLAISFFL